MWTEALGFPCCSAWGSAIPQPAPFPSRSSAPRLLRDQLLSQLPTSVSPPHVAPAARGTIWTRWYPQLGGTGPSASTPSRSLARTAKSYGARTIVLRSGAARRCPRRAAPGGGQIPPASPALPRPVAAPASRALPGSLHTEARPLRPDAQRVCVESPRTKAGKLLPGNRSCSRVPAKTFSSPGLVLPSSPSFGRRDVRLIWVWLLE